MSYEQVPAIEHQCPEGLLDSQLTEAFEDYSKEMAINYVNRIRGGIERLKIYPELDISIAAEGEVTKVEGGIVEVKKALWQEQNSLSVPIQILTGQSPIVGITGGDH